jgi:hypothetical protein
VSALRLESRHSTALGGAAAPFVGEGGRSLLGDRHRLLARRRLDAVEDGPIVAIDLRVVGLADLL